MRSAPQRATARSLAQAPDLPHDLIEARPAFRHAVEEPDHAGRASHVVEQRRALLAGAQRIIRILTGRITERELERSARTAADPAAGGHAQQRVLRGRHRHPTREAP